MKRLIFVIGSLLALSFLFSRLESGHEAFDEITYRGQTIRLSKRYVDYDDYKDDPENIAVSERPRVARLVVQAPVAPTYPNRWEMITGTGNIEFPGYGMSHYPEKIQSNNRILCPTSYEIPFTNQERFVLYESDDHGYHLIDDFVGAATPPIRAIERVGDQIQFADGQGAVVFTRPVPRETSPPTP